MLNEVVRWWKDRPRASQLALVALLLLCVSQFFTYYVSRNHGTLSISANWNTTGHYYFDPVKGGTGWAIHQWAPHVLMLLAALHGSSISESRHFRRFGYWLSLPLMFGALTPGSIETLGGKMGVTALVLMLLAAIWNWRSATPAAPSPPPPPQ